MPAKPADQKSLKGSNPTRRRAAQRKEQDYQSMRDKISFTKTWKALQEVEHAALTLAAVGDKEDSVKVSALKLLADSHWKKINKLLPDLKAMDIDMSGDMMATVHVIDLANNED